MAKVRQHAPVYCLACSIVLLAPSVFAQSISTSTPVPPLQWINLSGLLSGSPPPPLKDASIGYDESSRTLIIFGGESQTGLPQSNTYLLDLQNLSWSTPAPPSSVPNTSPPPRSAAISGGDFAASNRHGHLVIGGKGQNGQPLSDVWEYDYNNQFWTNVKISAGGPSARYDAAGGIDTRVSPVADTHGVPGPNNTFYLAGGVDSSGPVALSDVWQLEIAGTLSANLPDSVTGSWVQLKFDNLPARANQSGTVIAPDGSHSSVVAFGGCSTTDADDSCADNASNVISISDLSASSGSACPAPRVGAALVPNQNTFSSSFDHQVFLLNGLFDTSLWDDDDGHSKGEVDVLSIDTGSWARILPSGDPESKSAQFPTLREGAVAISYPLTLVGDARTIASDTIVFGGRDSNGNYLNDVWLLRAYNALVTKSGQHSSLFGDGTLQSGVNADGSGVTVSYMTVCASHTATPSPSVGSSSTSTSTTTTSTTTSSSPAHTTSAARPVQAFNTSVTHKIFAPLSVAVLMLALVGVRLSSSTTSPTVGGGKSVFRASIMVAAAAYAIGIAGLATSFSSITSKATLSKRSSSTGLMLKTAHGKAGLALAICLYGVVPLLGLVILCRDLSRPKDQMRDEEPPENDGEEQRHRRADSVSTTEKLNGRPGSRLTTSTAGLPSRSGSPPRMSSSGTANQPWTSLASRDRRVSSSEGESANTRSFEVVNRPRNNNRRTSEIAHNAEQLYPPVMPRSLSELSWLQRRRSVNAVGELDYALAQLHKPENPPTPAGTTDMLSTNGLMADGLPPPPMVEMPGSLTAVFHVVLHATILALCVLSLLALHDQDFTAPFAIFLVYVIVFYSAIFLLAWKGRPRHSVLVVLIGRLRGVPATIPPPPPSGPVPPTDQDQYTYPGSTPPAQLSPYIHQPPYHQAIGDTAEDESVAFHSSRQPLSMQTSDDDDDDDDESTRQRRIEEEINGRDVNIVHVTVPKRRLWVTNPS
ncbi:hypothetical protein PUNSTDRAFT_142689 [Punctularia strigosozonata HHB-11173 SS5]|uniref:uncharacterized protein n=1 Tax=Punctularia strigosozonata (strain HHB-11173) TaxID=741275 RepID=UPI00044180FE|nr:uncharacterized protein PUNSTDRAFT_142689 [Punctularia strigosozonata HHB-11173 SS5]EIN10748.1 hypothetical protein PUNSTDRAFT_142689 [Punctularia strigosozonata HHB-11173 SS5]